MSQKLTSFRLEYKRDALVKIFNMSVKTTNARGSQMWSRRARVEAVASQVDLVTRVGERREPPPQPLNACDKGPGRRGGSAGRGHPRGRGEAVDGADRHARAAAEHPGVGLRRVAAAAPRRAVAADAAGRVVALGAGLHLLRAHSAPAAHLALRARRVGRRALPVAHLHRGDPAEGACHRQVHPRLDGRAELVAGEARDRRRHRLHAHGGRQGRRLHGDRCVDDRGLGGVGRGVGRHRRVLCVVGRVDRRVHHVGRGVGGVRGVGAGVAHARVDQRQRAAGARRIGVGTLLHVEALVGGVEDAVAVAVAGGARRGAHEGARRELHRRGDRRRDRDRRRRDVDVRRRSVRHVDDGRGHADGADVDVHLLLAAAGEAERERDGERERAGRRGHVVHQGPPDHWVSQTFRASALAPVVPASIWPSASIKRYW